MVGSINFVYFCESDVSAVPGHPRSLILAPIKSAYALCNFVLVCNSNLGPILHRFWYTAAFMCSWLHPYSTLILGCSRCKIPMLGSAQRISLKLFGREIIFEVFKPMWSMIMVHKRYRQTDVQSTYCRITALCVALHSKNTLQHLIKNMRVRNFMHKSLSNTNMRFRRIKASTGWSANYFCTKSFQYIYLQQQPKKCWIYATITDIHYQPLWTVITYYTASMHSYHYQL